jgi:hypothetical protein
MARILIVHWNEEEAAERARRVRQAGFETDIFWQSENGAALRELRANVPDAVVVDLTRIPSHGRAVGVFLRGQKATRAVPLLFIEGDPQKTARTRELLPDAAYTSWDKIGPTLRKALRGAPARPVVPGAFAAYSGTALSRKLRIVEGSRVSLLAAPEDFESCLEPLPERASVSRGGDPEADVILAFTRSSAALGRALPALARAMKTGRTLWLIWPKKTSGLAGDLGEPMVRQMGLDAGLVDYKICAVDETWSGLAFAVRKNPLARARGVGERK